MTHRNSSNITILNLGFLLG